VGALGCDGVVADGRHASLFLADGRENGIIQRLTRPRSPATTGKIERLRQTLQQELLNVHGPFAVARRRSISAHLGTLTVT